MIHVLPECDSQNHEILTTCHCDPKVEINETGILVVHNAFDCRELLERVGYRSPGKEWLVLEVN